MSKIEIQAFHTTLHKPVQREVFRHRHLFSRSMRTSFQGSPHREAADLLIRVPTGYPDRPIAELYNELNCEWTDESAEMPLLCTLVDDIQSFLGAKKLGRVMLAALGPRKHIYPHPDEGMVPHYYERYHYVISTGKDCIFIVQNEALTLEAGMLFRADVRSPHAVANLGTQERINLIMDVRR